MQKDKLIAAQNEKIDLFIDDSIQHCKRINGGNIKTLLYTTIAKSRSRSTRVRKEFILGYKFMKSINK